MKLTLYFLGVFVLIRTSAKIHKYGFWGYVSMLAASVERGAYRLRNWAHGKQRVRIWRYPE